MPVVDELIKAVNDETVNQEEVKQIENQVTKEIVEYGLDIYKVVKGFLIIVIITTAIYVIYKVLKSL